MTETAATSELLRHLSDRKWRLCNLYSIRNKDGALVPFRPNAAQLKFMERMHHRNVVLKARQLGMTTFIVIYMLDAALWRPGTACGLVAHRFDDAKKFMTDKIQVAYDSLSAEVRAMVGAKVRSTQEMQWGNMSGMTVGVSLRSGTYQILHVSEFGKLSFQFPDKAKEIKTGAFPTVPRDGVIVVEATHEGGRGGEFYDLCVQAMQNEGKAKLSPMDWRFHFFAWWLDDGYALACSEEELAAELRGTELPKYFAELEKKGVNLTREQRMWYAKEAKVQKEMMVREYPSTPEEAWSVAVVGAYYAKEMGAARAAGRIASVPFDAQYPVSTFWDLGIDDSMTVGFAQFIGREIRWIDYYEKSDEGFPHFAAMLQSKREELGYQYAQHVAPHDIGARELSTGASRLVTAKKIGIEFTQLGVTPVQYGIDLVRPMIARSWFDAKRCDRMIAALEAYRSEYDETAAVRNPKPVHDWASHAADMVRGSAVALERGLVKAAIDRASIEVERTRLNRPGAMALSGFRKR